MQRSRLIPSWIVVSEIETCSIQAHEGAETILKADAVSSTLTSRVENYQKTKMGGNWDLSRSTTTPLRRACRHTRFCDGTCVRTLPSEGGRACCSRDVRGTHSALAMNRPIERNRSP